MNLSNYKTTLGGALSALGSTLMAVGIVPQLAGTPSKLLLVVTVIGFVLEALGKFCTALFSADAKQVQKLSDTVQLNTAAIITGDTNLLTKESAGVKTNQT